MLAVVDVWPVRYVELLINCIPPFFILSLNSAFIPLRPHVVTIKRVALRLLEYVQLTPECFLVELGTNHTGAESGVRVTHGALAVDFDEVSFLFFKPRGFGLVIFVRLNGFADSFVLCYYLCRFVFLNNL